MADILFNELLAKDHIGPEGVLVFRHTPREPRLREVLPWLAAERPEVFNAYQQTQSSNEEQKLLNAKYVASFIGRKGAEAIFIGLYKVGEHRPLTHSEYWQVPAYQQMKLLGMNGFTGNRASVLWFDLEITEFGSDWKGKLVIDWPPPPIAWARWIEDNNFRVRALVEDSLLIRPMPRWDEIILPWTELSVLPTAWRDALRQWRGIYRIFDRSDGKAYVGAAYGQDNIFGRWQQYGAVGHGGNARLRERSPVTFEFSLLQLVSQDAEAEEVIALETRWKNRLQTRHPFGLNEN